MNFGVALIKVYTLPLSLVYFTVTDHDEVYSPLWQYILRLQYVLPFGEIKLCNTYTYRIIQYSKHMLNVHMLTACEKGRENYHYCTQPRSHTSSPQRQHQSQFVLAV